MKHEQSKSQSVDDRVLLEAAQQGWGITLRLGFLKLCNRAVIQVAVTASGLAIILPTLAQR